MPTPIDAQPDASTGNHWHALSHAPGVWYHTYAFDSEGTANCVVVSITGGRLLVLSPSCDASDPLFEELAALGEVAALVAPNGMHYLGQQAWRERFPAARCFAPTPAMARIARKAPALGPFEPLEALAPLLGDGVVVREAPAARRGECWVIVEIPEGYLWFASDILANLPALPKRLLPRWMFRLSGSAPGYSLFHLALLATATDRKALLRAMRADVEAFPPTVLVPSHGVPLTGADLADRTLALLDRAL